MWFVLRSLGLCDWQTKIEKTLACERNRAEVNLKVASHRCRHARRRHCRRVANIKGSPSYHAVRQNNASPSSLITGRLYDTIVGRTDRSVRRSYRVNAQLWQCLPSPDLSYNRPPIAPPIYWIWILNAHALPDVQQTVFGSIALWNIVVALHTVAVYRCS